MRVTVEGGVVTAIDLLRHENGRGEKAEIVVDRVLAAQSLRVDAVSGATGSSKVILKAIERALKKAP
ncbi:FMN-binding protein [Aminithiophilus ramosus]|uniref:FMN-binding protein n=2 Tax=Synergistales TaxID=649776 RepID=A0A9Q7AH12_9BACT|nr:FMN-binding protein [Aminithiophilus ramosus]QTX33854.1 FMN-binding protein [Aminithiophilus ramosus]QVL37752.1 FMN-binding protein [Synergistota bacterium]